MANLNPAALSGTTPDWLRQRAAATPQRLALACGDRHLDFAELDAAVDNASSYLHARGIGRGDVLALLANNSIEFAVAVHGAARAGAVLMPLNLRLTPAELLWQLEDSGAAYLVADAAGAALTRGLDPLPGVRTISLDDLTSSTHQPEPQPGEAPYELASPQAIVYTSGTTGRPKGALLTYGNHLWSATASALNLGLQPDDRWLACLPLFHVGGLAILLRSVIYGTAAVIHERFDAAAVNRAIGQDGVTMISVVANMLRRMLDERAGRPYPPSLRCVLLGGGPAPEPLLRDSAVLGLPVVQTYGLTEAASQVATLAPEDALLKLGSAGKPLFGTELRIARDDGSGCPPGEAGEILVRGPVVMAGYLNRPEETRQALDGGWLHTGDAGYLDPDGYLYVLDRRNDLIVSGGENVYPAEIEAVLQSHPAVAEAGVYGVDDERWGRRPVGVVVLHDGAGLDADALLDYCRARLAAYKLPARIEFAAELPRNAAGKLMRSELPRRA